MENTKNPVTPKKGELRTVRVFVSSTFRDMHTERDYLNSSVFPELRSRCAKRGLDFVGIDLRWGVTEEESRQRKAMEVCQDEIKKCNFFISLLGDRYGWIPPPEEIPHEKFEAARGNKDLRTEDAKLLDEWYQLDETCKVPVYRLRNDIVSDTSAQKLVHFWEEAGLEHAGDSITAREIYLAQDKKLDKKTFFYLRKSDVYENPNFPRDMIPIFIDQDSNKLNKLSLLKKHIQKEKHEIYTANYEGLRIDPSYPASDLNEKEKEAFNDGVIQPNEWSSLGEKVREIIRSKGTVALTGMEELGNLILRDLWDAIEKEIEQSSEPLDAHSQERAYHDRFITERTKLFFGRTELLENMLGYVSNKEERKPLVVTGLPGCGKSALMAKYARQCHEKFPNALVVPHFIGAAPGSTDLLSTISSLCETFRRECKLEDEVSADPDKLRGQLHSFLEKAGSVHPIILLLDAVNQLDPAYRSHELTWIPLTLPPNVRLIVSTLAGDCLEGLKKRVSHENILQVPVLPEIDRKNLIKEHLARRGKKLSDKQIDCLLDTKKRQEAGLPLYLLVALEELCLFGNYEELNQRINMLPTTLNMLFDQVINRLEKDHMANRTELILRLMAVSRYGLLESEIIDQLGGGYLFNWDSIPGDDINRLVKFLKNDRKIRLPEKIEIIKTDDNKTIHVSSKEISIDIKLDEKKDNAFLRSSTGEIGTLQLKRENGRLNIHKMEFPRIYWTRFYRSLEFYLRPVDETTGAGLINFYHDQLRFAVYRRYLEMNSLDDAKTEKYRYSHDQLADYFHSLAADKNEPAKWSMENPRSLIELPYHLHESGRDEDLRKMLYDFGWIHSKLESTDVNSLIKDYDYIPDDRTLRLVQDAIRLSAHFFAEEKTQLKTQLYGRLMKQEEPEIKILINQIKQKPGPWLCPLIQNLTPPRGPLIRTLEGNVSGRVNAVVVSYDGKKIISASDDHTIKIWDIETGNVINILGGTYLFSWDDIPGNDNWKLIRFLKKTLSLDWVENAKIDKIDAGMTIKISFRNFFRSLGLNDKKTEVNLKPDYRLFQ